MRKILKLVKAAVDAAKAKKSSDITLLNIEGKSDICDYQLIVSGANPNQTAAIADNIERACRSLVGEKPLAVEGKASGHWILLDYGSLLVHVFLEEYRDYYALEDLWPESVVSGEALEALL